MKAEAKEERKKAEAVQEAALEKRREEQRLAEEGADRPQETDRVQISQAAKAALDRNPVEAAEPTGGGHRPLRRPGAAGGPPGALPLPAQRPGQGPDGDRRGRRPGGV